MSHLTSLQTVLLVILGANFGNFPSFFFLMDSRRKKYAFKNDFLSLSFSVLNLKAFRRGFLTSIEPSSGYSFFGCSETTSFKFVLLLRLEGSRGTFL